jgi:hypothetical protein
MVSRLRLSTRSTDFPGAPASLRLGGITIYAPDALELDRSYKVIADAIDNCSKSHLSLVRVALNSEVRKRANTNIDQRIFGAILNSQLRLGIIDSIPCAAITGKVFRIYVHCQQIDAFHRHLEMATAELRQGRPVNVPAIEGKIFGQRRWGTWSSAFHILARLTQMGRACYVDKNTFRWPQGIENAVK